MIERFMRSERMNARVIGQAQGASRADIAGPILGALQGLRREPLPRRRDLHVAARFPLEGRQPDSDDRNTHGDGALIQRLQTTSARHLVSWLSETSWRTDTTRSDHEIVWHLIRQDLPDLLLTVEDLLKGTAGQ